jgi:hypothetical protein
LREVSFGFVVSPQQFIELGLNGLSIPMLCPLDKKRYSQGGAPTACQSNEA